MADQTTGLTKRNLKVTRDETKTLDRQLAEACLDPHSLSATTAVNFAQFNWGLVDITESVEVLKEKSQKVRSGELGELEATLVAHSSALDSIFAEMARRSLMNIESNIDRTERYMRLALKAQGQCRATIEALALLKNPPVFAKQANINNGGQQQVNNGVPVPSTSTPNPRTYEANSINQPIKLLEAVHGQWVDTRKKSKASRSNQTLEAMGEVHGT